MEFIKSYRIKEDSHGNTLILYLNLSLTEFADEFASKQEDQVHNLDKLVIDFIKNNFPEIKFNTIKLMVGTMVIATITLQGSTG